MASSFRHNATGAGAIAEAVAASSAWQLIGVRIHMSAAGGAAEDFTVTIDSSVNAVYDVLLFTQDMNLVRDLFWQPTRPIVLLAADVIDIAYANTNVRTWGLEVIWQGGG